MTGYSAMGLSMSVERETPATPVRSLVHTRKVVCQGYVRDDGLWDIEATLVDTKPFEIGLIERRLIHPEEPIHGLMLRVAVDRKLLIHEAQASFTHSPYKICSSITQAYQQLVGMRIESGFIQAGRKLFRGVGGCTHVTELLGPLSTVAYQTLWNCLEGDGEGFDTLNTLPEFAVNGCHALREDGPIVQTYLRR